MLARLLMCLAATALATVTELSSWRLRDATGAGPIFEVRTPATVMKGMLEAHQLPEDVFYDAKMLEFPNITNPYVFSTEFEASPANPYHVIFFKGLNYKGTVALNGNNITLDDPIEGPFRFFYIDITTLVKSGRNYLDVFLTRPEDLVFPPNNNSTDLSITFVDWAPPPPDRGIGVWQEAYYLGNTGIHIDHPFLECDVVPVEAGQYMATCSLGIEVFNWMASVSPVVHLTFSVANGSAILVTEYVPRIFRKGRTVCTTPGFNRVMRREDLWWIWEKGPQTLYPLTVTAKVGDDVVSAVTYDVGFRSVTSALTAQGSLLFSLNGEPVLVRGGGWSPDLFLRDDASSYTTKLALARDVGLNTVRLEGKFERDMFYDIADRMGIFVLSGWCCCDAWQHWKYWTNHTAHVARESQFWQSVRLRRHASTMGFMIASDELAPPQYEEMFRDVLKETHFNAPVVSTASNITSPISGPSGVKMSGPYAWVPPVYWTAPQNSLHRLGGAFGFLTEGGPGASPMRLETWRTVVSRANFWPVNRVWDFHCANYQGVFRNLRFFIPPLEARYGTSASASQFLYKAQAQAYEAQRAMFDSYVGERYTSTGVVQWMLNNPFPSHMWNLFDYNYTSGGAYYGAKKGNAPVSFAYTPGNGRFFISNYLPASVSLWYRASIFHLPDGNTTEILPVTQLVLGPDSVQTVGGIHLLPVIEKLTFLRLTWTWNGTDYTNDYWISPKPDVLDWHRSTFYITYCKEYTDFTDLNSLPGVASQLSLRVKWQAEGFQLRVAVQNRASTVAFFVQVSLVCSSRDIEKDIIDDYDSPLSLLSPSAGNDNYITLRPNETRTVELPVPARASAACGGWHGVAVTDWGTVMAYNRRRSTLACTARDPSAEWTCLD